jgi:hypothetical protein
MAETLEAIAQKVQKRRCNYKQINKMWQMNGSRVIKTSIVLVD